MVVVHLGAVSRRIAGCVILVIDHLTIGLVVAHLGTATIVQRRVVLVIDDFKVGLASAHSFVGGTGESGDSAIAGHHSSIVPHPIVRDIIGNIIIVGHKTAAVSRKVFRCAALHIVTLRRRCDSIALTDAGSLQTLTVALARRDTRRRRKGRQIISIHFTSNS